MVMDETIMDEVVMDEVVVGEVVVAARLVEDAGGREGPGSSAWF